MCGKQSLDNGVAKGKPYLEVNKYNKRKGDQKIKQIRYKFKVRTVRMS